MKEVLLAPSLLASDFGRLKEEIEMINGSAADYFHVDVMDGNFVPNISFGQPILKFIQKYAQKPLDVHLMIVRPELCIEQFRDLGADTITVHAEACPHLHRTIGQIKESGAKAGVALNPSTSIVTIEDVLEDADLILIMSVNPGFGGQKFIYNSIPKIRRLKAQLIERNSSALIEIDGGVGLHNAEQIIKAGTDILVAGTSVFGANDPLEAIKKFKNIQIDTSIL